MVAILIAIARARMKAVRENTKASKGRVPVLNRPKMMMVRAITHHGKVVLVRVKIELGSKIKKTVNKMTGILILEKSKFLDLVKS